MERSAQVAVWKQKTVQYAISILQLIRLINAEGDVEMRRPARMPTRVRKKEVKEVQEGGWDWSFCGEKGCGELLVARER